MGGDSATKKKSYVLPRLSAGPVGKQIHDIYRDRLQQFTEDGQFAGQNLRGYDFFSLVRRATC